jgi:hypothetical protein
MDGKQTHDVPCLKPSGTKMSQIFFVQENDTVPVYSSIFTSQSNNSYNAIKKIYGRRNHSYFKEF